MADRALQPIRVEASRLGKSYGHRRALDDVSITLRPGSVTALLGHNGAGKSTLVRLLAGLVRGQGEIRFAGRPLYEHPFPHRVLGVDLGTPQTHPGRTVRDHLALLARGHPQPRTRISEIVELLGIGPLTDARPRGLSTGQKRTVALASTLLADPSVLILDEPINGLEVAAVRGVKELIRQHAARGGTVMLASHVLAEAERVADRVLVLHGGRLATHEDLSTYVGRHVHAEIEVRVDDPRRLLSVLRARGLTASFGPDGLVLVTGADARTVSRCAHDAGTLVLGLNPRRPTLEDVFLAGEPGARSGSGEAG